MISKEMMIYKKKKLNLKVVKKALKIRNVTSLIQVGLTKTVLIIKNGFLKVIKETVITFVMYVNKI